MFLKAKARMTTDDSKENEALSVDLESLKDLYNTLVKSDSVLRIAMGRDTFTGNDLDKYD